MLEDADELTYEFVGVFAFSLYEGVFYTMLFVELALGLAYLTAFAPALTNTVTLVLMIVGSIGVAQALQEKRAIQCACLGTALKLPMTKVTLAEDVVMGLMALVMLAI